MTHIEESKIVMKKQDSDTAVTQCSIPYFKSMLDENFMEHKVEMRE